MLNLLVSRKYGVEPSDITINTDHATLFVMSPLITKWLKDGQPTPFTPSNPDISQLFPNRDLHRGADGFHRTLATNIYKTKDGRCYHVHGSMNPDKSLTALGFPLDGQSDDTYDSVVERFQSRVSQFDAAEADGSKSVTRAAACLVPMRKQWVTMCPRL